MKKERTSYAFLMEMIWVCAFFLICACIFVLVFVKAEQLSHQAEVLNQAVQAASNAMEDTFAENGIVDPNRYATGDYTLSIETDNNDGLLSVTIQVLDPENGQVLYKLSGAHALKEGGTV